MVQPDDDVFPTQPPLRIGEMLVAQGVLTREQLNHALDVQAAVGRPLGDLCERLFNLDPSAVDLAWAQQFTSSRAAVDLAGEAIDPRAVRLLRPRQAWQFRLMPVRFDQLPSEPETPQHLVLATSAESLRRALNFAARSFTVPPSLIVASEASLLKSLRRHYPIAAHMESLALSL